jgi:hypothetical protein
MPSNLRRDDLMAAAATQTGLDDFGDVPFHEPLDVLVESLNREAGLDDVRERAAATTLTNLLVKRLRLVGDRKTYPAIADEVIRAPLFIVGLPRTGSTHLHALMGQAEGVRVPMFWEMAMPSPPPDAATYNTDPRIAQVQAMVDQMSPELMKRHPVAAQRPEQCNMLNDWSFIHQALLASSQIPTYRDWLFNADYRPAFEAHRRTLQHLQWRNPGQWVLKYPKHLMSLDVLLECYPDARLVWTHRDPAVVLPSVASLTGFMRASSTPTYDPKRFGPEWALFEELVLRRGLDTRDAMSDADSRIFDLHYRDLMQDQLGSVEAIYRHFGMPFTDIARAGVQRWIDEHPRTKHGEHTYTAEEFGLDADRLRERFRFYMDRFDVRPEVKRSAQP